MMSSGQRRERTTVLWALHIQGLDMVCAAPSWAAAAEAAAWFKYQYAQRRTPAVSFAAVPWPHSAESHAKELPRWRDVYGGRIGFPREATAYLAKTTVVVEPPT